MTVPKDDRAVLAELVGDLDTFASDHWGRRPLLRHAGAKWATVLSVDDVESLMLSGARPPTFRLVRNGERLAPERSTRPTRLAGQAIADVADLARIAAEVGDGATLIAQALERTSLPVARLCRSLERATSHTVQANAYLTPPGSMGLGAHHDDHDVIVVQQSGEKAWNVDGLGDITLTPGDVLYLPARTTHAAQAQTAASLHLTIGLLTRTWASVVRGVVDGIDELRTSLPLGFAYDDDFAATLAARLRSAADAIGSVDAEAVAAREVRRVRNHRGPLLEGHLDDVLRLGEIGLSTTVIRRADQPVTVEADDGRVNVVMGDRTVSFPAVGLAALETLITGEPVTVADLPGIDDESKVVVVRRLVRAGLLAVV